MKKATGFDVQSYIDEAKRRLDEGSSAGGAGATGTDAADRPEGDSDSDEDGKNPED